ncbi:MAG: hypothetical protein IPG04_17325 [Polyangiaceae bacterium]|nr:hypothetical protein [Polyangiaceae bacterium]
MAEQIPAGPWHEEPELWDTAVLNDVECPGICKVEISRGNKWDEKKAKGSHGAEREYSGAEPAKVKLSIVTWTSAHHTVMREKVLPIVEPVPGKKKVDAVQLQHAVAIARSVSAFTVDDVDGPSVSDGKATWKISGTEYRKPSTQNATGTAKGGKGGNPKLAGSCVEMTQLYALAAAAAEAAKRRRDEIGAQILAYGGAPGDTISSALAGLDALQEQYTAADREYQGYSGNRDTIAVQMKAVCGAFAPPSSQSSTTSSAEAAA